MTWTGPTTTLPPAACTFSVVAATSSVETYVLHAAGMPLARISGPISAIPATRPPFESHCV